MISKKRKFQKNNRSFNPTTMSIELSEALNRDLDGCNTSVKPTPASLLFRNTQKEKLLSKFSTSEEDTDTLEEESFAKFLRMNNHMRTVNEHFSKCPVTTPVAIPSVSTFDLDIVLNRAKALVKFVLTPLDEDEWFHGCKSSVGSSIGVPYSNTSPERKYTYPLSVADKKLIPMWDRYCLFNPEFATAVTNLNSATILGEKFNIVGSSRATTVEKSTTSRRMIAVEPVLNMFFQQGLMTALVGRLNDVGLDITSVPELHRQLAMENSITASKDTVDFSSASDCVSLGFLRWLLPPSWFEMIDLVRCPTMNIGGDDIKLEMISTMGNGTTFPIETLVFWSIAVSSAMTVAQPNNRSLLPDWRFFDQVSVFGDDCITPRNCTALFMAATEAVGFIVNTDKSFFDGGYFRESCGGDFYRGCNVRPAFLRAPTSTKRSALEPWLYTFLNKITTKYISYFGSSTYVYDKDLYRLIFSTFRKERLLVKVVPNWFPDDSGFKIGDDCHRFQSAYDIPFSRISVSDQGLVRFSYCNFRYRQREDWHDGLRYALHLLQRQTVPSGSRSLLGVSNIDDVIEYLRYDKRFPKWRREIEHWYNIRKLGGYVVATSYSSCWSPPSFGAS